MIVITLSVSAPLLSGDVVSHPWAFSYSDDMLLRALIKPVLRRVDGVNYWLIIGAGCSL